MPNIKSAKKRVLVNGENAKHNATIRTSYKTAVKKFDAAIDKKENVEEAYKAAIRAVDKAHAQGVLKTNTTARKKSALTKKLNACK